MIWVAIEDADTCEIYDFEPASDAEVFGLLSDYKVTMSSPTTKFRMREVEGDRRVVYEGVIYRGGFGCNLWVADKYVEVAKRDITRLRLRDAESFDGIILTGDSDDIILDVQAAKQTSKATSSKASK